jgi:hypothetical protein
MGTRVKFNHEKHGAAHNIYLARGRDHAGNVYADPTVSDVAKAAYREQHHRGSH